MCITASGNILANGNLCFRVFKLHFKVIKKNVIYYSYSYASISYLIYFKISSDLLKVH